MFGIVFDKEQFGDTVKFLDVSVSNCIGALTTVINAVMLIGILHHNSFHPKHTFTGIPFAQRRAVLICSNDYLRDMIWFHIF